MFLNSGRTKNQHILEKNMQIFGLLFFQCKVQKFTERKKVLTGLVAFGLSQNSLLHFPQGISAANQQSKQAQTR